MSLQKYAALLRAVELGSISKAAAQMGYTQSAVSRMPPSTSLSAFCTRQPLRRRTSMKLAADGSTITAVMCLLPARF